MNAQSESHTLTTLRNGLLAIFAIAVIGMIVELILLEHYDSATQFIPFTLMGASLLILGWFLTTRSKQSLRVFRFMMFLFVAGGITGVLLHYNGNRLFELSITPELPAFDLFWKSITGATPALAPGSMIPVGLVGLAYTFRHPILNVKHEQPKRGD